MTSTLGIKKIQYPNGTNVATLDSSGSIAFAGEMTLATHLNMGDGDIIKLGADADLQIQHNGSNSIIRDNGTGSLDLQVSNFAVVNTASNEFLAKGTEDGPFELYHNGSKKIETTSTGVNITGAVNIGGTGTANALDDYEEGTWTPTQGNQSTWSSPVFNAQYIKIGKMVRVQAELTSGTISIAKTYFGGLPFSMTTAGHKSFGYMSNAGLDDLGACFAYGQNQIFPLTGSLPNQTNGFTFAITYFTAA